ncbi:hypothetical protein GEMRC1_001081 [Eukaryota sp. GEM-RC1]
MSKSIQYSTLTGYHFTHTPEPIHLPKVSHCIPETPRLPSIDDLPYPNNIIADLLDSIVSSALFSSFLSLNSHSNDLPLLSNQELPLLSPSSSFKLQSPVSSVHTLSHDLLLTTSSTGLSVLSLEGDVLSTLDLAIDSSVSVSICPQQVHQSKGSYCYVLSLEMFKVLHCCSNGILTALSLPEAVSAEEIVHVSWSFCHHKKRSITFDCESHVEFPFLTICSNSTFHLFKFKNSDLLPVLSVNVEELEAIDKKLNFTKFLGDFIYCRDPLANFQNLVIILFFNSSSAVEFSLVGDKRSSKTLTFPSTIENLKFCDSNTVCLFFF